MAWHSAARALALSLLLFAAGCATLPDANVDRADREQVAAGSVLRSFALTPELEKRILALDPEHISEDDVRSILEKAPTPRIMLLHGGVYPVHLAMTSFGKFLIGMGYPEEKIRQRPDGRYSESPYTSSTKLAGEIAWYYEQEATRLMLVGHSQGGMHALKVLDELAGEFSSSIPVWDPVNDRPLARSTITDPVSGMQRPVVGLTVAYASAIGAGGPALLLPNQWPMIGRLRDVPDTVDEFTGYAIGVDLFAWNFGEGNSGSFRARGATVVRNVVLPADYVHVTAPAAQRLARSKAMRDWLNAYVPGAEVDTDSLPDGPHENVLYAADVWFSIKKHWCLEAQRIVRARRAMTVAVP
jgi:hypothetical protein